MFKDSIRTQGPAHSSSAHISNPRGDEVDQKFA